MVIKPEDPVAPEKLPPAEAVRARLHLTERRFGRAGRLKSWATVLVGVIILVACAFLFGLTF